ncbi:MAG: hypothetical protein IJ711_02175 [Lachnospiraceae bacterium]|nr:hypothetical protein [Lachnospiraceae bacterium]
MRKNIIKAAVGVIVFVAALLLADLLMNQGNSNMTVEMGKASLPVVRIVYDGTTLNTMHGYTKQMEGQYLKDSVFWLGDDRTVRLQVEPFDASVKSMGFEVRSTDGQRLVEDTPIVDYAQNQDMLEADFTIKDLTDADTEYMLTVLLTLDDGRTARYYTRFIQGTDYHMQEMLSFALDFHRRTFDKEAAKEITRYLESNAEGDNTNYAHVNIHSSFAQITWGDLKIKKETEPEITVRDITSQFGVIELSYQVSMQDGREKDEYTVAERYRIRYGTQRMYLLDFERDMEVLFDPEQAEYGSNKISIGIADPDMELAECEGGNIFAFIQSGRLYSYNPSDNKVTTVFSFYDKENKDVRTMYPAHNIKILGIEETGNIRFMVYGYMNRGTYEGSVGAQVYYYNSMHNTIEEEVYIPYGKSYELLGKNMEQLSYVSNTNHLFLLLDGMLYDIDLVQKSYTEIVSGLTEGGYQVSKSSRMVVWQNEEDYNACTELTLMNLGSRTQSIIQAGAGEYIRPLGFIEEDLIYGVAYKKDLATDGFGGILFPMHTVRIRGESGNILKTYSEEGIYVVAAEIVANQINLRRVKREGANVGEEELDADTVSMNEIDVTAYSSDDYEMVKDDQIVNTESTDSGSNTLEVVATKEYEKILQIATKNSITEKSLKFLTPKIVAYEGGREIALESESALDYCYVYGPYGLDSIRQNESEAVLRADELFGMVYDKSGNYLFRKGTMQLRNQIMKIEAAQKTEERSSLAVCLDTMLLAEGVTKNSAYLLQHGGTVKSILEDNLEDARVLDLTGCSVDIVLYYVNQDIPVLASLDNNEAVLIVGFNELNTVLMDPSTGTIYKKGMNDSRAMFEQAGNRFVTYVRNP